MSPNILTIFLFHFSSNWLFVTCLIEEKKDLQTYGNFLRGSEVYGDKKTILNAADDPKVILPL